MSNTHTAVTLKLTPLAFDMSEAVPGSNDNWLDNSNPALLQESIIPTPQTKYDYEVAQLCLEANAQGFSLRTAQGSVVLKDQQVIKVADTAFRVHLESQQLVPCQTPMEMFACDPYLYDEINIQQPINQCYEDNALDFLLEKSNHRTIKKAIAQTMPPLTHLSNSHTIAKTYTEQAPVDTLDELLNYQPTKIVKTIPEKIPEKGLLAKLSQFFTT